MSAKLYVGNLLYEATEDDLKDLFGQVGTVVSAVIIRFRDSGRSKGFGFVEMGSEEEAKKAMESLHGTDFKGRKLVVSEARPPRERTAYKAPAASDAAPAVVQAPSDEMPAVPDDNADAKQESPAKE